MHRPDYHRTRKSDGFHPNLTDQGGFLTEPIEHVRRSVFEVRIDSYELARVEDGPFALVMGFKISSCAIERGDISGERTHGLFMPRMTEIPTITPINFYRLLSRMV